MTDPHSPGRTWLVLILSVLTLAGSLWLSIGMGLKPCPLCFYQRTFVMAIVAVLAVGLIAHTRPTALASLFALPMGVAALAIAGFHVSLELRGRLECPGGVLGIGTAPQQSLAALVILVALLASDVLRARAALRTAIGSTLAGALLGMGLAYAAVASSPPLPAPPDAPYTEAPVVCRPPFEAP